MKIPVSDLKKRWKHLRDHYKKKKKAASAGQASSESTWEYMSQLNFLSQVPSQRNSITNTEVVTEIEIQLNKTYPPSGSTPHEIDKQNETISQESLDNVSLAQDPEVINKCLKNTEESMAPPIKKRRKCNENSSASIVKQNQEERTRVHEKILKSPAPKKSSIHKFFDAMADIVSEFPPHLVAEARLKVCQVVNDLEMKKNNNQFVWSSSSFSDSSDSSTNL
ncbi:unnamed protein product [Arctia plantaginis]|uniref:MADF domain-containing protein n=1 Tax=Arctia plantaginis TaxID=874455 RepID=A0A8S1AQ26_ARCPL|nr:unnamed protein product [Arctia plantaginis]